jgi:hypothetical protein
LPDRTRSGDHFSCTQAEDMSNRCPLLHEHIDLIHSQTPYRCVRDIRVLGNTMTNSRIWPTAAGRRLPAERLISKPGSSRLD